MLGQSPPRTATGEVDEYRGVAEWRNAVPIELDVELERDLDVHAGGGFYVLASLVACVRASVPTRLVSAPCGYSVCGGLAPLRLSRAPLTSIA